MNIGFVKNIIIAGLLVVGGGIDMMHIMIYACSNLLPVITVDMVQHQAVQLGGLH